MKKYKFTEETRRCLGHNLHRIIALRDFGDVKEGDVGGWIEKEENLSHEGTCWVYDDSKILGNVEIRDNAQIRGNSLVTHSAQIFDNAKIEGHSEIWDFAQIFDDATVNQGYISGTAWIFENAVITNGSHIFNNAMVYGNAKIGNKKIYNGHHVH